MSKRFRYILSAACALLAVLLAVSYAQGEKASAEAARQEALKKYGGDVASVVVATKELSAGETLSKTNCELRDWIVDFMPEGALTSLDSAVGSVVTVPVASGAAIANVDLRKTGESLEIPSGCVAMSVAINDKTGITTSVNVGTKLAAYKIAGGACRLLSNEVSVLSTPATTQSSKDASITLAIPAEEISSVMSAYADATLRLVQPADDVEGLEKTSGIDVVAPVDGQTPSAEDTTQDAQSAQ